MRRSMQISRRQRGNKRCGIALGGKSQGLKKEAIAEMLIASEYPNIGINSGGSLQGCS